MPLTKVSTDWFIRITQPHDFVKVQLSGITQWESVVRVIVVSHVGEKTKKEHVHMLLTLNEALQQQSVNAKFKKFFKEARCMSIKVWDGKTSGQSALSYLWHDKSAEVLFNKGFTDVEIQDSKVVCASVVEEVNKRKQRAPGHCVSKILDEIVESKRVWNEEQICMRILKLIQEGSMYEPGDFMISRYVNEIYSKQPQPRDRWKLWATARVCKILRKDFVDIEHTQQYANDDSSS